MDNESSRFRSREEQHGNAQEKMTGQPLEFNSAEELIRHDAAHTVVPPVVASRLKKSLATGSSGKISWWKKIFKPGS